MSFALGALLYSLGFVMGMAIVSWPFKPAQAPAGPVKEVAESAKERGERHRPIAYKFEGETEHYFLKLSAGRAAAVVDKNHGEPRHEPFRIRLLEEGKASATIVDYEPTLADARITAEHFIKTTLKEKAS